MKKKILSILLSLTLILTGINLSTDKVEAAGSKDSNYEYMTFLIMGRFTAYPTKNGSSLQATWNSGNGARTNPVSLGQKVNIHVGSGDGASPNLIPAEDVSKWQIEYVGEYDNAPYGFDWGTDNNYHQYEDWLEEEVDFKKNYLAYTPNDLNFKNYSLDKNGNIVFDLSMTLKQRGKDEYNYFNKLRREYEPPSLIWDYWGGKSELQNNDPLFAQEIDRALDNYNKTSWDGYIFPYPFVVVLKRPVAGEGITYEGYFLENGTMIKPYEDTKHTLDVPIDFTADDITGYELVGSKQALEIAPTGAIKKGISSYNVTWKKENNKYNFRKNYIHYYYKPKGAEPPLNPPPKFTYTSVPQSYGEIKQGTYSPDRSSEKWNAMAGVPHDSTLFTDVGASFISVDIATDTTWATTDNTSPSAHDVNGKGTHTTTSCSDGCGGSYCINPGCPDPGQDCSPCSGHELQTGVDKDGKPTYKTEYRDHRHGRCSASTEQWTESFPVVQSFDVKAHQIGSFDIKTPMELNANVPYIQEDVSIKQNEQVKAIETKATWDEVKGLTGSIPAVKCYEESRFRALAYNKVKDDYMANKSFFNYNPPAFSANGLGESLDFLEQTKAKFVQTNTIFNGSLSYRPQHIKAGLPLNSTSFKYWEITTSSNMNSYKTNFKPEFNNWSASSDIPYVGYDGSYNSYGRRGADRALFYKSGLHIANHRINNGQKETGVYGVDFVRTDSRGVDVAALDHAQATYSENHNSVNDIIVHSPISVSKLELIPKNALADQRVDSQKSDLQRLTPDSEFSVIFHTTWTGNVMVNSPAIGEITPRTGKGYTYGLQTDPWIKKKAISFPFEVISLWDNTRHSKNQIIDLDKSVSIYNFYIPISEIEIKEGEIKGFLEAKNNLRQDIKYKTWNSLNEKRYDNNTEDYYFAADHFVTKNEKTDLVGRIGNFEFSYTDDQWYQNFFLKPDLNKPQIKTVLWDSKKPYEFNKYVGPSVDMYQRSTSNLHNGLDRWNAIPRLNHKPNAIWPAQGDINAKNIGTNIRVMNSKLIKLGYHQWFSLQTVGNYDENSKVTIYPSYQILNTKTGQIKDVGSIFVASGNKYYQSYPFTKVAEGSKQLSKIITKLNTELRFIQGNERIRTDLVDTYPLSLDKNVNIGNMSKIVLDRNVRTYIGGFRTEQGTNEDIDVKHNNSDQGGYSNTAHAKQAQRWHGSIFLPSSSVFLEPGKAFNTEKDLIDTKENCVLLVKFNVETSSDKGPWNLKTTAQTLGSYNSNPELRLYDKGDNSFIRNISLPLGTIAAFDISERSFNDVTISGIH